MRPILIIIGVLLIECMHIEHRTWVEVVIDYLDTFG